MAKIFNVIDIFSGAGGLSEGFMQTGNYNFLAHIEWEKPMVDTLRQNLTKRWGYTKEASTKAVLHFDVQKTDELINGNWSLETQKKYKNTNHENFSLLGLDGLINDNTIDIIIGGPPCQAYSIAGRAQDPNSMRNDYRNYLFESFLKLVDYYKPKLFVFENVPGILSAKPGDISVLERIYDAFNKIGYDIRSPIEMKKSVYLVSEYGVPQKRKRVIIFGVKKDSEIKLNLLYKNLDQLKDTSKVLTVFDTINKLPKFFPLDQAIKKGNENISHYSNSNKRIEYHQPRFHNSRDINIFKKWIENKMNLRSTSEKLNFYLQETGNKSNHNKYRSLDWDKPSPTIVAHLYKDGLMFIHPDINQARSITVKEAALIQTFPDNYIFTGSSASAFKMIGNAVPILFSKKIAEAITNYWRDFN